MSQTDFEAYLALLTRFLRLDSRQRESIRRELHAHLEDAIEDEVARGSSREDAILRVLDDFGDAAELAGRFSELGRRRRLIMRGTMTAACIGFAFLAYHAFSPDAVQPVSADSGGLRAAPAGRTAEWTVQERAGVTERRNEADEAVHKALRQRVPKVAFEDAPLEQVMDWFREFLGVNVYVQWQRLEDVGVSADTTVSATLSNVSAERILRLLLDDLGEGLQVAYEVLDGVLIISTNEQFMRRLTTEVYDVRDFLEAFGRAATKAHRGSGGAIDGGSASGDSEAQTVVTPQEQLSEMLHDAIEPDTWAANGGFGWQGVYNGVLVVRQYESVHRQIAKLLRDLRETGATE
jgi:hypothetical protein